MQLLEHMYFRVAFVTVVAVDKSFAVCKATNLVVFSLPLKSAIAFAVLDGLDVCEYAELNVPSFLYGEGIYLSLSL